MKKMSVFGLSAAVMLLVTPTASAGYWTGHAEVFKDWIENWLASHTSLVSPGQAARNAAPAPQAPHSGARNRVTDTRR